MFSHGDDCLLTGKVLNKRSTNNALRLRDLADILRKIPRRILFARDSSTRLKMLPIHFCGFGDPSASKRVVVQGDRPGRSIKSRS